MFSALKYSTRVTRRHVQLVLWYAGGPRGGVVVAVVVVPSPGEVPGVEGGGEEEVVDACDTEDFFQFEGGMGWGLVVSRGRLDSEKPGFVVDQSLSVCVEWSVWRVAFSQRLLSSVAFVTCTPTDSVCV